MRKRRDEEKLPKLEQRILALKDEQLKREWDTHEAKRMTLTSMQDGNIQATDHT